MCYLRAGGISGGMGRLAQTRLTSKSKGKGMITIKIDVRQGQITCGANGGHIRAPHGTVITWKSTGEDKKFELEFFQLGIETADAELEHWPFQETPPSGPTNTFAGTLKKLVANDLAPAYKYNVKVGNLVLDPIVIVDR
jgi:hypothetical protein